MHIPRAYVMPPEQVRPFVAAVGSAQLVTVAADGRPLATQLAILWEGDAVLTHIARDNPHFGQLRDGSPCLLIVQGPDGYVSPRWHGPHVADGRVLPTWNYSTVQIEGILRVRDDDDWLHALLERTIRHHEAHRDEPWLLEHADGAHVRRILPGAVGLEVEVTLVAAAAKLSQDKSDAARAGIASGLRGEGARGLAVADAMESGGA